MGELSLISVLDGEGCGEDSILGYGGLILWILIAIYIFMGLYILCEDFFVPSLTIVGEKMNLSQDICGATLLAAGSSSPELFTALIGTFLYPDENPGPATNCASAVFNMCIIIGLSILYTPNNPGRDDVGEDGNYYLLLIPFIRDTIFYGLSIIFLFLFYQVTSQGQFEFWESFIMVLMYIIYVVILAYNDKINSFLARHNVIKDATSNNNNNINNDDDNEMNNVKMSAKKSGIKTNKGNVLIKPLLSDDFGVDNNKQDTTYKNTQGTQTWMTETYSKKIGARNYSTHKKSTSLVVLPSRTATNYLAYKKTIARHPPQEVDSSEHPEHAEHPDDVKNEDNINININNNKNNNNKATVVSKEIVEKFENPECKDKLLLYFEYSIMPFKYVFGLSFCGLNFGHGHDQHNENNNNGQDHDNDEIELQHVEHGGKEKTDKKKDADDVSTVDGVDKFSCNQLFLACVVSILWLAILTFLIVDLSNKIGLCLSLNANIMGLTLLAIGSSLPDAFSSILVAKQGKLSMAVSTALGSNIFDICICVGLPFLIKSIYKTVLVDSDDAFLIFLFGIFLTLNAYIVMFVPFKLRVKKIHGWLLLAMYVVFIIIFICVFTLV